MKRIISLFIILSLAMAFNASSAFAIITGIFDVYADQNSTSTNLAGPQPPYTSAPLDTGFDIHIGDTINITASGQWSENGYPLKYGPDGLSADWLFPHFSLVGKISDIQLPFYETPLVLEKYFFIGSSLQNFIAPVNGRFYMAFNDSDYGNNVGYVTANVTITPIPEPSSLLLLGFGLLGALFKKKS